MNFLKPLVSGLLGLSAYLLSVYTPFHPGWITGLYVLAYLAGGLEVAKHTLPKLLGGEFDVEFLMLAAATGAAALGNWAEGALLLFLFSLGHALEHYAHERASDAIHALGQITPKTALVRRDGVETQLGVELLQLKDLVIVKPADRIPVDGQVTKGQSSVDQSPITGESLPVQKDPGQPVFAGSINGEGSLEITVTKLVQDSTMARMIKMVEEAQKQKSPTQSFSEKVERILVPSILITVLTMSVLPPLCGWLNWKVAILRALGTLVAASPCALALATPSAILAGIAQAARQGVLIKGGAHLESLGRVRAIALDKTGTVTTGQLEVTDILTSGAVSAVQLLQLAGSVESHSNHPLAQAVVRRAKADKLALSKIGNLQNIPGKGVSTEIAGQQVLVGNRKLFSDAALTVPPELEAKLVQLSLSGKPWMLVSKGREILGAIAMADQIRPETMSTVESLLKHGIESVCMLTGDNLQVAQSIAKAAGIRDFKAELLPEDKVAAIRELAEKYGSVAMVGDGVNDAPALAYATVGIAMGAAGTDVALETADVALMADDLSKLVFALLLSRSASRIIKQNLLVSLGVIVLLVPSTLLGFAGISTSIVLHEGSTVFVVFNALRLLRSR